MNAVEEVITLARELKQSIQANEALPLNKKRLARHYVLQFEEKRDLTVLRLFSKLDGDFNLIPKARNLTALLRTHGPSELVRDVEKQHVEAFYLIHDAVKGAALRNTNTVVAHHNDDIFALGVLSMLFNETEKAPLVSNLILERGLTSTESLEEVLNEMDEQHSTLREGAL